MALPFTLARASFRFSLHHPWQLGLSLLGIGLGVAVVVAIDVAADSAGRAFEASNRAVLGATTHQIVGPGAGVDEHAYARLRQLARPGVAGPVVEGDVSVVGVPGRAFMLLGVDPFAEAEFDRHLSGRGPGMHVDVGALLTQPDTAVVGEHTARTLGVVPGGTITLKIHGRSHVLKVVGTVAGATQLSQQHTANLVVVDIATAQELLSQHGRISRIDLVLPDTSEGARIAGRIEAALPPGTELLPAASRSDATLEMTRAFRLNLTMLSLLALLVGMFIIYNTLSFSVVQRHALLGRLRALGVTRRQVLQLVLGEALLLGLVGSVLGLVLGLGLATELVKLVARTINDLYFTVEVTRITLSGVLLLKGVVLGVLVSLAAAAAPALEAGRVAPRVAQLRSRQESRFKALAPVLAAAGLVLVVSSLVLVFASGRHLGPGFAALFALVIGFTLLTPLAALVFMAALHPLARRLTTSLGPLTVRGATGGLSRTAVAIAALTMALATTVGVTVMVDSFRQSLADWLQVTLQADVYVSVPGPRGARIDERIVAGIGRVDGVVELSMAAAGYARLRDGAVVELAAIKMASGSYHGFRFVAGDPKTAWPLFDATGQVLVTEPFSWRHGVGVGDALELQTDRGYRVFRIAGVVRDYGSEQGTVVMSRASFDNWWHRPGVSSVGVYTDGELDPEVLVTHIERLAGGVQDVYARSNRGLREASMVVFERTFTITAVLRMLATVVAFVGVLSALMAIQLERRHEVAVLRALGMTRAQVARMVAAQTSLMGALAGLLCMPLGVAMAWMLTAVINRRSFGWGIDLSVGAAPLLTAAALALLAALLAGAYPAWRMTRGDPGMALRRGEMTPL